MPRTPDRRLIRYLHGELPADEVRRLRAELAHDPALQARLAELHRVWQRLQPPPPTPAPFGFVPRLQRLADGRRASASSSLIGWAAAPAAVRALAGAALLAGVALGIGLGRLPQPTAAPLRVELPPAVPAARTATAESAATAASPSPPPALAAPAAPPAARVAPPPVDAADTAAVEPADGDLLGGTTLAEAYWEALAGADDGGVEGNGEP
jgi:hypothetical protein